MSLSKLQHWLRRARKRLWEAVARLRRLRERHPGKQEKARKRDAKREVHHRTETKEKLARRVERKKKWLAEHDDPKPAPSSNIGSWDGRQVAGWMVGSAPGPNGSRRNWLQEITNRGWNGQLFSGYRSPEYSESLCIYQCGQPSCPGTCAGRASNHSGLTYPAGAIDVDDWGDFQAANNAIGGPFRNYLPRDAPHRSVSGY